MMCPHNPSRQRPPSRGVSLIEALVALAVMSFGMLALVGVQATMRVNTDAARQTTEAMRLAAQDVESTRLFTNVRQLPGQTLGSWDEMAGRVDADSGLPGDTANVTYGLTRNVTAVPMATAALIEAGVTPPQMKLVQTVVTWADRTNETRSVRLHGLVAAASPALSGQLAVSPLPGSPAQRGGRHVAIPASASDLGDGRSRWVPPGSSSLAWYFDNASAALKVCAIDGTSCVTAYLISGYAQWHLPSVHGDAANAVTPVGNVGAADLQLAGGPSTLTLSGSTATASCYAGTAVANATPYFCAVVPATGSSSWSGRLDLGVVNSAGTSRIGSTDPLVKVCRYSTGSANHQHPASYSNVAENLINQNYLVIWAIASGGCPSGVVSNGVNYSTVLHQP